MKYSVITTCYKQLPYLIENKRYWDAQTYKDFEWIIAMDEDSPETRQFCVENNLKYVWQLNEGYRYGTIINKAVAIAEGLYIVIANGDSYPKEDFLERLDMTVRPERVVNGVRMNVSPNGTVISSDWRVSAFGQDLVDEQRITFPDPWKAMTMNSECVSKALFEKIGGMCELYHLYGKEDWDFNMRAYFDGAEFYWANTAILYHRNHDDRVDSEANTELFTKRLAEYKAKYSTERKEQMIMDRDRAILKEAERQKHMREVEQQQEQWEKEDKA